LKKKKSVISKLLQSSTLLKVFLVVCDFPLGFVFPTHPTSIYNRREGSVSAAIAARIQSSSQEANRFAPQRASPILASSMPRYYLFVPSPTSVLFYRAWNFRTSAPGLRQHELRSPSRDTEVIKLHRAERKLLSDYCEFVRWVRHALRFPSLPGFA